MCLSLAGFIPPSEASELEWKELNQKIAALHAEGDYTEAARVAEKALQTAQETYGEDHLHVAKSMNNLANLYLLQGESRSDKAVGLYKKAITLEEKLLGQDHPNVADTLFNLAMLYTFLEQYDQALPLLERSLAIKGKKLGREHPEFLKVKKALDEVKTSQQGLRPN